MSDKLKSILFAAIVAFVCSVMLTSASLGLKPFRERNMILDRQSNILKSVGLIDETARVTPDKIEELYKANIKSVWVNASGTLVTEKERSPKDLPIYLFQDKGQINAYIIPINTRGLWGEIQGYMALEKDGSTIKGFTVYKHVETPGLGAEIEQNWFRKNFIGKKIVSVSGEFASISIAKGKVSEVIPDDQQMNFVDGISGATLTGKYLSEGFREILGKYEQVSIKFRKNRIRVPSS